MFTINKKDLCAALGVLAAPENKFSPDLGLVTFGEAINTTEAGGLISLTAVDTEWAARVMVPVQFRHPSGPGEPVGLDSASLRHLSHGPGRISFHPDIKERITGFETDGMWGELEQYRTPFVGPLGEKPVPFVPGPAPVILGLGKSLMIEAAAFADTLDIIAMAASTEATRYYLNGTAVEAGGGHAPPFLDVTATDGHRMVSIPFSTRASSAGWPSTIIPRGTIKRLCAFLRLVGGEVQMSTEDDRVTFRNEDTDSRFTLKAIDGAFPDWRRVVPQWDERQTYVFGRAQLVTAINRVARASSRRQECLIEFGATSVRLHVQFRTERSDVVTIFRTEFPAKSASGKHIGRRPRGCNFKYLRSIATMLRDSETIHATIRDDGQAMLFRGETGIRAVLMPMRINPDDYGIAPGWE